jgi:hypothetical protein
MRGGFLILAKRKDHIASFGRGRQDVLILVYWATRIWISFFLFIFSNPDDSVGPIDPFFVTRDLGRAARKKLNFIVGWNSEIKLLQNRKEATFDRNYGPSMARRCSIAEPQQVLALMTHLDFVVA